MSKDALIETIQQHNPTAEPAFLVRFDEAALERYLMHLRHLSQPRSIGWVRTFETPAIMVRTRGQAA